MNQTNILGLIIAIINPCENELEFILYVSILFSLFFLNKKKRPRMIKNTEPQI